MILDLELKAALSLNLKQLRENRKNENGSKTTQNDVAEAIGMTQKTYSLIESGHSWPQHETLVKIARYFGVDETDLVTDKNLLALRELIKTQNK